MHAPVFDRGERERERRGAERHGAGRGTLSQRGGQRLAAMRAVALPEPEQQREHGHREQQRRGRPAAAHQRRHTTTRKESANTDMTHGRPRSAIIFSKS